MSYGAEQGVPWGISESAYNVRDLDLTYQYSNFGVPGLGLERGLSDDLVIAPYATALAAMVEPAAAAENLRRLADVGARGSYGFYEALDYTGSRLPEGATVAIVRAYMAHHQGMTLVALSNVLREGGMRAWFHAEPIIQATELLLQERAPRDVAVARPRVEEVEAPAHARDFKAPVFRQFTSPHDPIRRTHLLSNGRYSVMLTAAGSGYSRCGGLEVTRWREDVTRDHWGTYIFVRDVVSGAVWSTGYQPTGVEPDAYRVTFFEDHAEFFRRDGAITTALEVLVSPEDDAEVRRVSITNFDVQDRELELTSYAELVLTSAAADAAHPAFSKLFVQTESLPRLEALLATRRVRSPEEPSVWAAHVVVVEGESGGGAQFETDRARFLGRGRGIRTPMSVIDGRPLSNTTGSVLDPIVSLRRRVRLRPGESAHLVFSTLVTSSRDAAVALADKYRDPATFDRTVTLAWTQAQVQLHHLGIDPSEAHLFQDLAGRILYSDPTLRPSADTLKRNRSGAAALWPYGISGDLPIILVRIDEPEDRDIVRQLLRAHEYWRMKGLSVDLVILNEKAALLRGGSPDVTRDTGPDEPVGTAAGPARSPGQGLHPEKGSPLRGGARCPPGGGPGHPPEPTRHAGRAARARPPGPVESGPASTPAGESGAPHRCPAAPPRARVLERPGRLCRRRPRVRDGPGGGAMDARALDQCRRQSRARVPGVGVRRRIHVVGQ